MCTCTGTVRLIATGFGEAATAVTNLAVDLDPGAHVVPGPSSGVRAAAWWVGRLPSVA